MSGGVEENRDMGRRTAGEDIQLPTREAVERSDTRPEVLRDHLLRDVRQPVRELLEHVSPVSGLSFAVKPGETNQERCALVKHTAIKNQEEFCPLGVVCRRLEAVRMTRREVPQVAWMLSFIG